MTKEINRDKPKAKPEDIKKLLLEKQRRKKNVMAG